MTNIDYLKSLTVAHGILKTLEQQNATMTYGQFWVAMGLGPWKANYSRRCVKNILEMLDAIDRRAHGKRVLHLHRIVTASHGLCGRGVFFVNRITRRPMTEQETQEVSFSMVETEHVSRLRNEAAVAAQLAIQDPVDPNCISGEA